MQTVDILTNNRNRLLDVKIRTSVLDDLVVKALVSVQEKYLHAGSDDDSECDSKRSEYNLPSDMDSEDGDTGAAAGGGGVA